MSGWALMLSILFASPVLDGECPRAPDAVSSLIASVDAATGTADVDGCFRYQTFYNRAQSWSHQRRVQAFNKLAPILRGTDDPTDQQRANAIGALSVLVQLELEKRGHTETATKLLDWMLWLADKDPHVMNRRQAVVNLRKLTNVPRSYRDKINERSKRFFPTEPHYDTMFAQPNRDGQTVVLVHAGTSLSEIKDDDGWVKVAEEFGATVRENRAESQLEVTYEVGDTQYLIIVDTVFGKGWSRVDIFSRMSDRARPIEVYQYHAQRGRGLRESFASAEPDTTSTKLFFSSCCKGTVYSARMQRMFPSIDIVATRDSQYGPQTTRSLLIMLREFAERKSWEQIRAAFEQSQLRSPGNYTFPDQLSSLRFLDSDKDGVSDLHDRVFDHDLVEPRIVSVTYEPQLPIAPPCRLSAARLFKALRVADGMLDYSRHTDDLRGKFKGAGWGSYDADGPMFRFQKNNDGTYWVWGNPAYSQLDETALATAATHQLVSRGLADRGVDERTAGMTGLVLATKLLDSWSDPHYSRFQAEFGFEEKTFSSSELIGDYVVGSGFSKEAIEKLVGLLP